MPTRIFLGSFFATVFFFHPFVSPAFAALTINDFSPQVISSAQDPVIISASASGLSDITQYFQVVMTKAGEPTDYFGWTKNNAENWYQYKSSPATSDLQSTFFHFQPNGGNWLGQIVARIDTTDSGFKGPGDYLVKLAKYISSSPTYSNAVTLKVNVSAPENTPSQISSEKEKSSVISWSTNSSGVLGQKFEVKITLSDFPPGQEYLVKLRGGKEETSLTKAQTENGGELYSDNDAWANFPKFKTEGNGTWNGTIWAVIPDDQESGIFKIRLRLKNISSDKLTDSEIHDINLAKPEPAQVNTIAPTELTTTTALNSPEDYDEAIPTFSGQATNPGQILGQSTETPSGNRLSAASDNNKTNSGKSTEAPGNLEPFLIVLGLFIFGFSLPWIFKSALFSGIIQLARRLRKQ